MTTTHQAIRIAVLGAGGRAGRAITSEAVHRGHYVTAIVRDLARHRDLAEQNVTVTAGDALDADSIVRAASGARALVSAVTPFTAPPASFGDFDTGYYVRVADCLTRAAAEIGIARVVEVGLFAILRTSDGRLVSDEPDLFPEALVPFARAHAAGADRLRETGRDHDWLILAPPPALSPEVPSRGSYRLGDDTLDLQRSNMPLSYNDLAVAVVDQIDRPTRRQELTAVYGT
jgi:putative NADH-flavin reductase